MPLLLPWAIDWDAFRPLLADLYLNAAGRGSRPNYGVVLMIRLLVLQQWYGLSDPELERQATDRISLHYFLGYPEAIPDRSMVWLFRERPACLRRHASERTGRDAAQPRWYLGKEELKILLRVETPYPAGQGQSADPPDRDYHRIAP